MSITLHRLLLLLALAIGSLGLTACGGDEDGSATMRPGEACIACHADDGEAPTFSFAGTVFGADGVQGAEGVTVTVEDSAATTVEVTSNRAGNFFSETSLTPPFTVTLTSSGGATATMAIDATHGDCNLCHREGGDAGGPLVAP